MIQMQMRYRSLQFAERMFCSKKLFLAHTLRMTLSMKEPLVRFASVHPTLLSDGLSLRPL